jgi:hypothetical protein
MKFINRIVLVTLFLTLTSCGGSEDNSLNWLKLSITDAPVLDAKTVVIAFDKIELKHSDQTYTIDFSTNELGYRAIDLLSLQGALQEELFNQEFLVGDYQWIRIIITTADGASYIELNDGSVHDLEIPSGSQSGLKLNQGFTLPAFGNADFTLDFDLSKSLVVTGNGKYHLKPVIRMVDNTEAGHIHGDIATALMDQNNCQDASVYLFDGSDSEFDDLGSASEPLTSAIVTYNDVDMLYQYEIGFVPFGDYSLHLLCNPDDPELDETITSFAASNATVDSDGFTTVDFE